MKLDAGRLITAAITSLYFLFCVLTPRQGHFIDAANLIFHEAGHVIFIFFGQFIHVLMGSGFQVLLPLLITAYFFSTGQRLSAAITLMWAGENMTNVSVYAGDAIAMQLPLLGGDASFHDWHYLLTTHNVLAWTPEIASTIYVLGVLTTLTGVILAFKYAITVSDSYLNVFQAR